MLPPVKQDALADFLDRKWGADSTCPYCKANNWSLDGYVMLPVLDRIGPPINAPMMPLVFVTCQNCGNTVFINALIAGVPPPRFGEPTIPAVVIPGAKGDGNG